MELVSKIKKEKLDIVKFSWNEILSHNIKKRVDDQYWQESKAMRKKIIDNCEAYVHWLLGVVKKYVVSPPKGKKWSALCLYMNQKNIEYLHSQLESFVWLDVAPTCCRELADDEYGVDPKNITTDTP